MNIDLVIAFPSGYNIYSLKTKKTRESRSRVLVSTGLLYRGERWVIVPVRLLQLPPTDWIIIRNTVLKLQAIFSAS
jgi:hypothetical protein